MASEFSRMPNVLPEQVKGFTKELHMQMRIGGGLQQASYGMIDPAGVRMPFTYGHRSDPKHPENAYRGFFIEGHKKALTWEELRAIWPEWIKQKKAKSK